jgi:hypothetical protein
MRDPFSQGVHPRMPGRVPQSDATTLGGERKPIIYALVQAATASCRGRYHTDRQPGSRQATVR